VYLLRYLKRYTKIFNQNIFNPTIAISHLLNYNTFKLNFKNNYMALVFDIETIGEDFDQMDEVSQKMMTRSIANLDAEVYESERERIKNETGLSPLTGEIVSIAVYDTKTDKGAVYFQTGDEQMSKFEDGDIKYKPMSEKEMLDNFWRLSEKYDKFVTFNGRGFDVPFMMIRSAVHKIRPIKDLLSNRYLGLQKFGAKHIDLMDQLSFYGAIWKKYSLHMCCRAFGIESPKEEGVSGDMVGELYKNKKYLDIARYNMRDVVSTGKLYKIWRDFISF
jgi:hypothetical protein